MFGIRFFYVILFFLTRDMTGQVTMNIKGKWLVLGNITSCETYIKICETFFYTRITFSQNNQPL